MTTSPVRPASPPAGQLTIRIASSPRLGMVAGRPPVQQPADTARRVADTHPDVSGHAEPSSAAQPQQAVHLLGQHRVVTRPSVSGQRPVVLPPHLDPQLFNDAIKDIACRVQGFICRVRMILRRWRLLCGRIRTPETDVMFRDRQGGLRLV